MRCYDVLGRTVSERGITGATNAGLCPTGGTANTVSRIWDIPDRSFGYDLAGRMSSASNASASESFAFDAAGRLSSAVGPLGTFGYVYDAASNPVLQGYGDGFTAVYGFDALHRTTGAGYVPPGGSSEIAAATIAYDPLSRRTGVAFADGSSEAYTYDAADRVRTIIHLFPNSTASDVEYEYGYDAAGRDLSRTISSGAYRLYPTVGTTSYGAANGLNQYPSVGGTTYRYWQEGPLQGDAVLTHYYDELDGHVAAGGPSGTSLNWTRDALGRATAFAKVGAAATLSESLGYDGLRAEAVQQRIAVTPAGSSSPTVTGERDSVLGPEPDERLMWEDVDGSLYYPHTDRQGSTIALSKGGSAVTQWRYGPYGESPDAVTMPAAASDPQSYPFRYTGQRYDSDFGLYDYKARTYSPALGRFLQPDPAGVDMGPNLYAYVGNDPLGAEDPGGMRGCVIRYGCGGGISTVEGVVGSDANVENALLANGMGPLAQGTAGAGQAESNVSGVSVPSVDNIRIAQGPAIPEVDPDPADNARDEIGRVPDSEISRIESGRIQDPSYTYDQTKEPTVQNFKDDIEKDLDPTTRAAFRSDPLELHHIQPRYLGGERNGRVVAIPRSYHRSITNAFRQLAPYGRTIPSPEDVVRIMKQVYSKFPLP